MNIVTGVAHPQAMALAFLQVKCGWDDLACHGVGHPVDGPSVETLFGSVIFGEGHIERLIRCSGGVTSFRKARIVPFERPGGKPLRFAGLARVFDDNAHPVPAIIVVEVAHNPNARMIHFHDGGNALGCADPQHRNPRWIRRSYHSVFLFARVSSKAYGFSFGVWCPFSAHSALHKGLKTTDILTGPMRRESTDVLETKEFCGAARPSKSLKGKGGNFCPLIAPQKSAVKLAQNLFFEIYSDMALESFTPLRVITRAEFRSPGEQSTSRNLGRNAQHKRVFQYLFRRSSWDSFRIARHPPESA